MFTPIKFLWKNRYILFQTTANDIYARYAVLEEAKKKDNFDKKAMFRYLDEMLVNYSYNENRLLRYANDIGLFMFSKYFFRTPKAIYKMMKKNPLFYNRITKDAGNIILQMNENK